MPRLLPLFPLQLVVFPGSAFQRILDELSSMDETPAVPIRKPDPNDPFLSFQLADAVDDLDFRNTFQRSRSEAERLRSFAGFAEGYVAKKQYAAKMKHTAPL